MRVNSVARVGFGTVHPVLEELAAAVNGLVGARGSVVGCHTALADAKWQGPGPSHRLLRRGRRMPEDRRPAFTICVSSLDRSLPVPLQR